MIDLLWLIQSILYYFLGLSLAVNVGKDLDKLWNFTGLLFFVIGLLALMLGQPYWFSGLLALGSLVCFLRARFRATK